MTHINHDYIYPQHFTGVLIPAESYVGIKVRESPEDLVHMMDGHTCRIEAMSMFPYTSPTATAICMMLYGRTPELLLNAWESVYGESCFWTSNELILLVLSDHVD